MKIITFFIALVIVAASCRKEESNSSTNTPLPPATDSCGDRYNKELFPTVKASLNIPYGAALNIAGTQENLLLDLYEPDGDTAKRRAMVIFVHGGGWTSGSKMQGKELCTLLAKKGYIAATIDYRLGIENPVTDKTRGEAVYRGVQDVKAAIRFARANAALYKIDTSQIFLGGYSAGAVNAIHASYWDESEVPQNIDKVRWGSLEGSSGNPGYSSAVKVVYAIAGSIVDLSWIQSGEPPIVCVHSRTDRTEPYESGLDAKGIFVYGGAAIVPKAQSLNISATLFTYDSIAHGEYLQPAYFPVTANAVSTFLYSKVKCPK